MATLVFSSTFWLPGSTAILRVQVRDAETSAVLQARANTGIREDVAGSGFYIYEALLADAAAYEVVWDAGGAVFDPASATGEIYQPSGGTTTINNFTTVTPVPVVVQTPGPSPLPGVFYIKRRDTREPIIYQALEGNQPVDISGSTILFKLRTTPDDLAGIIFSKPANILDGPNGWMIYQWTSPDTDGEGSFDAEYEVTFPDGRIKTFPTTTDLAREYITVHVVPDLD